jgi:hypothetical protein
MMRSFFFDGAWRDDRCTLPVFTGIARPACFLSGPHFYESGDVMSTAADKAIAVERVR